MTDFAVEKILEIRRRDFPELNEKLLKEVYALLKEHAHDEEPNRSMNKIRNLVEEHVNASVSEAAS